MLCVPAGKQDCQGSWSPWSACAPVDIDMRCGPGTKTRLYVIVSTAVNGGQPCEAADGSVETAGCMSSPCNCTGTPSQQQAPYVQSWECENKTVHTGTCSGTCMVDGTANATCNNGVFSVVATCTASKLGLPAGGLLGFRGWGGGIVWACIIGYTEGAHAKRGTYDMSSGDCV